MKRTVDRYRIFLASPRDVNDERRIVYETVSRLQYDPSFRDTCSLEVVSWDGPHDTIPLLANVDPQSAIARGLPRPSECEIVLVILRSRMGTPLGPKYVKPDGTPFRSGTEWEYLDAMWAADRDGTPDIIVYRCSELPTVVLPLSEEKYRDLSAQYEAVEVFFTEMRALARGFNQYADLTDFSGQLEHHLRTQLEWLRRQPESANPASQFIESLIADAGESQVPSESVPLALSIADDRQRPPHIRVLVLEALCRAIRDSDPANQSILTASNPLIVDPDMTVARAAVKLLGALAMAGACDSRELAPAATHPAWEVRTQLVYTLLRIDDSHIYEVAECIRNLTYHVPVKRLAAFVLERSSLLTSAQRSSAARAINQLLANEVSDQVRAKLEDALEHVLGG